MKVKDLKTMLKHLPDDAELCMASDEEHNDIYTGAQIEDGDNPNEFILTPWGRPKSGMFEA